MTSLSMLFPSKHDMISPDLYPGPSVSAEPGFYVMLFGMSDQARSQYFIT